MESHEILDRQITVSSHTDTFKLDDVRLQARDASWTAKNKNKEQWIVVEFAEKVAIVGVTTQGDGAESSEARVTQYKLQYCLLYTSPSPRD